MNLRTALAAGVSPFAHLVGIAPPRAAPPAAESTATSEDDAAEADAAAKREAERKRKARKAKEAAGQGGEDGADGEDGEDGEDGQDGEDGADGADGEDGQDCDERDMAVAATRTVRLRERARCAAIFADAAAGRNPALAATLAFTTSLPRREAVAVLRAGGAPPGRPGLDGRMATAPATAIGATGAGPEAGSAAEAVARINAAADKARGGKK